MYLSVQDKEKSINHFKTFFDFATMGIVVAGINGEIIAINQFALNEFGYTEKELTGKNIETLMPLRFHKKHEHHRMKYSENPQARQMGKVMDLFALRNDGSEFPVEISLGNYNNNGDKYVIAFISNISVRKKAETEIRKLNEELESTVEQRTKELKEVLHLLEITNDRLEEVISVQKAIVDNAGAMIFATNEKGIINYFNPEAASCIGYTESDVINKHTPVLFHDKAEIVKKREDLYNKYGVIIENDFDVMVEKAKRNVHAEEQYTYIRKNKTSFPVLLTITAIYNNEGAITGFMGIAIDITERIKSEQKLVDSLKKEKELSELKSRFVSIASHEFRTPLSTVLSSAYLIEKYEKSEDQPKREKHLERIVSSVGMLTDILNDFLSVGKIEEGKTQMKPLLVNIKDLIMAIVKELQNTLKKKQKIKYQHEGNKELFMDPSLFKHIVMNLISNASKFSPEGSPVDIKTINRNTNLILSVKDYGIGISKEDQRHLTERFFRGANATNIQGTGLGLHIVAKYAELMGGNVQCISELEKGSEFIVRFDTKTD